MHKSNVINIDQLGSVDLLRRLDPQNLARQRDMIGDINGTFRDKFGETNRNAGIVLPGGIVSLRQINLTYMMAAELVKEAEDITFYKKIEPDIGNLEDPQISYATLVSSENDDLKRVVVGFAERASMTQWSD